MKGPVFPTSLQIFGFVCDIVAFLILAIDGGGGDVASYCLFLGPLLLWNNFRFSKKVAKIVHRVPVLTSPSSLYCSHLTLP